MIMNNYNKIIDYMNNELSGREADMVRENLLPGAGYDELLAIDKMLGRYASNVVVPEKITNRIFEETKQTGKKEKKAGSQGFITVFTSFSNSVVFNYFSLFFNVLVVFSTMMSGLIETVPGKKQVPAPEMNFVAFRQDTTVASHVPELSPETKHSGNLIKHIQPDNQVRVPAEQAIIEHSEVIEHEIVPPAGLTNVELLPGAMMDVASPSQGIEKFYYEFRANLLTNLNGKPDYIIDDAVLRNFSLGLWYELQPNLHIGAEFRQEPYITNTKGADVERSLTCWEAGLRYFPDIDILSATPWFQANLGGCKSGLTTRVATGLRLQIDNKLQVIGGVEIGGLLYNSSRGMYFNSKTGFDIGFSIKL